MDRFEKNIIKTNKYHKYYTQLIDYRKDNPATGDIEKHHILPRSMGGGNSKDNIVHLTPREHYVCHRLLVKFTTGVDRTKMWCALMCFIHGFVPRKDERIDLYKITSRSISDCRINSKNMCMWKLDKTKDELFHINIKKSMPGESNPFYGKRHDPKNILKGVSVRKANGNGDYFCGKSNPFESDELKQMNRERMSSNKNPMKNKTFKEKAGKKRLNTITTFEYWYNNHFIKKENYKEVEEYVLQNLDNVKLNDLFQFGLKRDFSKSVVDRFKKEYESEVA